MAIAIFWAKSLKNSSFYHISLGKRISGINNWYSYLQPTGIASVSLYRGNEKIFLTALIIMAQILDPLPNNNKDSILCCYVNATSNIQVARITNIPNWYFERVVFPGQRLVFEALSEAVLEIHSGMMASAILSDTIPCTRLCVNDSGDCDLSAVSMPVILETEKVTKKSVESLQSAVSYF